MTATMTITIETTGSINPIKVRKATPKPALQAQWLESDRPQRLARIALVHASGRTDEGYYLIEERPCNVEDARDFHISEVDVTEQADGYDVLIGSNDQDHHCTCLGFSYSGKACRHIKAIRQLCQENEPTIKAYDPQNDGTADEYRAAHDEAPF